MRLAMMLAGFAAVVVLTGCAYVRLAPVDAQVVDPTSVIPRSTPNWALAASKEVTTAGIPTREAPVYATGPEELIGYLDEVAKAEPRVEALPSADPLVRGYVQRSALIGFPDVITARVVDLGVGDAGRRTGLALYSRSIYGHSDLGVNAERLDRWIAALDEKVARVR